MYCEDWSFIILGFGFFEFHVINVGLVVMKCSWEGITLKLFKKDSFRASEFFKNKSCLNRKFVTFL